MNLCIHRSMAGPPCTHSNPDALRCPTRACSQAWGENSSFSSNTHSHTLAGSQSVALVLALASRSQTHAILCPGCQTLWGVQNTKPSPSLKVSNENMQQKVNWESFYTTVTRPTFQLSDGMPSILHEREERGRDDRSRWHDQKQTANQTDRSTGCKHKQD